MTNIKRYTYSEILSFFTTFDPPDFFQSNSPVFTSESQVPILISDFKPNPNFGSKAYNFVPKKIKSSESGNENIQKFVPNLNAYNFKPQIIQEEKNETTDSNKKNEPNNLTNNSNQSNKYRFRPELIGKPSSASAPPNNYNQDTNQVQAQISSNDSDSKINSEDSNEKISSSNDDFNDKNSTPFDFRPAKEFKPQKENIIQPAANIEEQKTENKKGNAWGNVSVKLNKNGDKPEKNNSNQLQNEIDKSLISFAKSRLYDEVELPKPNPKATFAPKKLEYEYEAPDLPTEAPPKPSQKTKPTTNFDEIEKEEKTQSKQQSQNQNAVQPKKGLFESILEQEKQNQTQNPKKETENDNEAPKKQTTKKKGFNPKMADQFFDGPSIDEIEKPSNSKQNNKKEVKSGFSALMEQEKISAEKEKKEKQNAKSIKKPSIVDLLIAEEKSKEKQKEPVDVEEEKEEKPSFQGFKPLKAKTSYEAPSIQEIENYLRQPQKNTTFSEALSNINQDSKNNFEELQKKEEAQKAQNQKKAPRSSAPSFLDLLVKEEKREKENIKSNNESINKENEKPTQKKQFNPKRNKPESGSFAEMIDKEKKLQKESKPKNVTASNTPANVKKPLSSKRPGNFPSFAQLIDDEIRNEEQRSTPFSQGTAPQGDDTNTSFDQKVADEKLQSYVSSMGDFVNVQGELPKKYSKKNRGRKRGGGNSRFIENSDFFWGTANDDENDDNDQTGQNESQDSEPSNFGHQKDMRTQSKDKRITWLSKVLEEELGEENPSEFAESLVNKSKSEMIRFLSTITFDQQQASNIAARFFQMFPK